jgi:hypothetical protein
MPEKSPLTRQNHKRRDAIVPKAICTLGKVSICIINQPVAALKISMLDNEHVLFFLLKYQF